jgi:CHAT domain-containing protein
MYLCLRISIQESKFVGDETSITYLSSARELDYDSSASVYVVVKNGTGLNLATEHPTSPPTVLADPDFAQPDPSAQVQWDGVPETADDARYIKGLYTDAIIRPSREASRATLQKIVSPAFLHIGSHAFYDSSDHYSNGVLIDYAVDPMLAGGVVLAGANKPDKEDDGIASPVDFAGLDLRGTELVFVSACSSGGGTVREGEGLYGIRRALRLAGSRTQILALWPVDRDAASEFVRKFYDTWSASGTVQDAFKAAQRYVRKSHSYWEDDPYYWGAFTLSGMPFQ